MSYQMKNPIIYRMIPIDVMIKVNFILEKLAAQRQGSAGPWHKVFAGWRRSKYFMSWSRMHPIVGQILMDGVTSAILITKNYFLVQFKSSFANSSPTSEAVYLPVHVLAFELVKVDMASKDPSFTLTIRADALATY